VEVLRPDACGLAEAARLLRGGGVIAFPTDTVYGLAALASDLVAVGRIYQLKGRPLSQPLILMVADVASLDASVVIDERASEYVARWWPGPLTLVLPAREGAATIAVRIPDHPVALALLREVGKPVATTSANRSGEPPALVPEEAARLPGLDAVLDGGRTPGGVPSTLLDLTGKVPRVLREGPISPSSLVSDDMGCRT
jgi:L-threonylcarbamoyladenylate synthase